IIAIGTDNNQMMIITKCVSSECKQLHVIQTPDILSSLFPAFFYINIIFKDGTLSARIGKASLAGSLRSDGSALVVFEDPEPIHVMYAGFRTTKCSGVWTSSKQIISKPEATTTTKAVKQPTSPVVPQPGPTENGSNQSAAALAAPSALEEEPSDKVTFTTSGLDNESPRYEVGPLDSSRPSRFEFLVTAAAGAVVSLSPAVDSEYPSYKLHIGVNRNSETHIMRCTSIYYCTAVLTVQTDSILTSSKPVKFFVELIRCGRTNKLNVRLGQIAGAAGADSVILDYEETYPLEIGWAGFGTIEGFTGQWTVYKFIFYSGTTLISSFNTGKGPGDSIYPRSYSVLRDQSEMRFSFSVKAEQNALIALSNQASVLAATDVIQIRLGVDNNQRSTLSKNNIEIVSVQGDHLLRFSDVTFWVSIDGNIIEVGMGSGDRFMGAVLDEPIHAKYIWFAAGDDGLTYEWQFYKYFYYSASTGHLESTHDIDLFQAHIYEQSSLEEKFEYSFHPLHENYFGKYIEFTVTTEGAVSIALSADGSQQVEMYEIVFSGNRNSDLSLRRCSSCETLVSSYEEGGFLLPGRVRNFLISVYDGTIRVYDEQLTDPLLEWTDPEPLPVSFAGFSMTSSSHFAYTTVPTAGSYTDEAPSPYFYAVQLATDKPWKVVLSISGEQKGEVYEIVYGTGENTRSEIRRGNVPIASVENAGLVSAVNPNYYWFEVKNNVIKTGLFDPDSSQQCEPFLGYYDPDFIPVSLFRISTSDPAAVFNFGFGSGFSPRLEPGNRICEPYAHAVYTSEEVEMVGKEGAVSDGESSDHESKSKEKRSSNERRNDRSSEENISSNESGSKEGMRSSEQSGRSQMKWSSEENAGNNEVRSSNEKSDSDETKSSEESGNSEEKRENDGKNKDKKNKGSKEDRSNSEEKRESEGKNKKGERKESSDEDRSGSEEKRNSKEKSSKEKGKKKNRGKKKESSEDSK
ncbi:uncharacterized protein LOC121431751, partial [Lytechinus variegatus]|uniref:uncharacterized protein LOC121431751 n=1 Tax=Lytechinus variegatus TaxID=7654 RepID=UPI001BB1B2F9